MYCNLTKPRQFSLHSAKKPVNRESFVLGRICSLRYVIGPAKINHVNAEESPLNSAVVIEIYFVSINSWQVMIEQMKKISNFCTQMVDFRRHSHTYEYSPSLDYY